MNDHQLAEMNGGTVLHLGGEVVYDFGFVATENPEIYTNETDDDIDLTPNKHGKLLLTDFSKAANGGKHFPRVWQLTGSCFPAGTLVRMADGSEKPIERIKLFDEVRSHTGQSQLVRDVMKRRYQKQMYTLVVKGYPFPIAATDNHPFAVWRDGEMVFVNAEDLNIGDKLIVGSKVAIQPTKSVEVTQYLQLATYNNQRAKISRFAEAKVDTASKVGVKSSRFKNYIPKNIEVNEDLGRLIGLYLAEGGCNEGRVTFTFHRKEVDLAEEVRTLIKKCFDVDAKVELQQSRPTVCKVRCSNKALADFLKGFVKGNVYTKRVPSVFMHASEAVRKSLLSGWLDGDGHETTRPNQYAVVGVSVCENLVRDMFAIAVSLDINAKVHVRKARRQSKQAYSLHMTGQEIADLMGNKFATCKDWSEKRCEFGNLFPITKIVSEDVDCDVYDITVDEDHTFIANNLVVHNCVRQGGYHALTNRAGVEVCLLPQAERFAPVDTWLAYAASRARFNGGDREGEGSTGDGMALELGRVGAIPLDHPLAAKYADCGDVIVYDRAVEFNQSSIRNYKQEYLQVAKKFTVQRQTVRSASEAVAELNKGRPLTWAGTWGGLMNCPVEEGLLLNRHAGTWNHQQECPGYWDHTKLGLLFFIQNNWFMPTNDCKVEYSGRNISRVVKPGKCVSVHGTTANYNEPPGGYWIREKDMDFQCRSGEVRSLSGFNGFDGKVGTDAI